MIEQETNEPNSSLPVGETPLGQATSNDSKTEPKKKTSGTKRTSKKSAKQTSDEIQSAVKERRIELIGIGIVLISILLLIAIFSYSPEDDATIENVLFSDMFSDFGAFRDAVKLATTKLHNPLGLFGAKLSGFLMKSILGYPTAIIVGVAGIWGWSLFRKKGFERASYATVYGILFALLIGSIFGLTSIGISEVMSGSIGRFIASVLKAGIGEFGAWSVLTVMLLVTIGLLIDLDFQKTADRITFMLRDKAEFAKVKFKEWHHERELAREKRNRIEAEILARENEFLEEETDETESFQTASNEKSVAESSVIIEEPAIQEPVKPAVSLDVLIAQQGTKSSLSEKDLIPISSQHNSQSVSSDSETLKEKPLSNVSLGDIPLTIVPPIVSPISPTTISAPIEIEATRLVSYNANDLTQKKSSGSGNQTNTEKLDLRTLMQEHASDSKVQPKRDFHTDQIESKEPVTRDLTEPEKKESTNEDLIEESLAKDNSINTNWANAYVDEEPIQEKLNQDMSDDDLINKVLIPDLKQAEEKKQKEKSNISPTVSEPSITVNKGVKEKQADLDERNLEVETREKITYQFPSVDLLTEPEPDTDTVSIEELEENKRKLLEKLRIYKIEVVKVQATVGPRVTLFELELAPDVKVSRIVSLENDLAMAMAARGIRIIAPIPGKNAVGVEIPNAKSKIVRIKSLLQSEKFKNSKATLPIAFGRTISNEIYIDDLAKMPHLLVAGATGSGKSVGINTILASLIYFCSPEKVKFLLIDPKRVELFPYQKLKNHFLVKYRDLDEQIITDTSKAVYALKSVEKEMDVRYDRLAKVGVRNIQGYNEKFPKDSLPFIVVVIDELADMMITAGRDVEEPIARLAQLARAVGIHLVVATQRPSVDVITGVIKANFPARIAYQVASKVDSRTILDSIGADQLLGYGDMLYQPASEPKPIRIQNAFVSTEEVEAITDFIFKQKGFETPFELPAPDLKLQGSKSSLEEEDGVGSGDRDKMFDEAARVVVRHQQGSVSLLQRRLKLGFGRAARIIDQLEEAGIVGPPDGSKARMVIVNSEESLEILLRDLNGHG